MRYFLFHIIVVLLSVSGFAQTQYDPEFFRTVPHISFEAHANQSFGFDSYSYPHDFGRFEKLELKGKVLYPIPFKSVGFKKTDKVNAILQNITRFERDKLLFLINDSSLQVNFQLINDSLLTLSLPASETDYTIFARYKGRLLGKMKVEVFKILYQDIILVNLLETQVDPKPLQNEINSIYNQANFEVRIRTVVDFSDSVFNSTTVFDNPSSRNDRYTKQMRELRDRYFDVFPNADKDAFIVFVIPGFNDENIQGYMVRGRAMAFVKHNQEDDLSVTMARELARGIGMLDQYWLKWNTDPGTTKNLMDQNEGLELNQSQWDRLRNSSNSYSFYDGDEDVKTNNGMVAYYFWEEDERGVIQLNGQNPMSLIHRPFKKNYLSYHLNVSDVMFTVLVSYYTYFICYWHLLIWSALLLVWIIFRWWIKRKIKRLPIDQEKIKLKAVKLFSAPVFLGLFVLSYLYINTELRKYEVNAGRIDDFHGQSADFVKKNILNNTNLRYRNENELSSEILLKRNGEWQMKRRKRVLYFDIVKDSSGNAEFCRFRHDSDTLTLRSMNFIEKAESHYMVFSYYNQNDSLESQKAFNHVGIEISNKLDIDDAAKRILVFVNGYRPTSVGHSFEDNFSDIRNNGLEFPQTSNMIYSFDRYDYWRPWNEIDLLFKKKINAEDVYYADGHHSVSTSNYRSILNFTRVSSQYPKKCRNPKGHNCQRIRLPSTGIMGDKMVDTYTMLPTSPNVVGFNERKKNGEIAGRNLLMMLNEIPNRSDNDTLYLVVHSMGYAYALGMMEELRGKIRFGGFYILAPENASQGKVNPYEWQEVRQYGSKWNSKEKDPPCLQDGVAPQTKVKGLKEADRAYIPENYYRKKGFFDAHFVGYYTWIFKLKEDERGYIRQR